jgi:transposase
LDHEPGSPVRLKKKQRDRLIQLCETQEEWVLGFMDEVWWSRLAQPQLKSWTEDKPLRLVEKVWTKAETAPKALCCYGLLRADSEQVLLRFVDGRPVSHVTIDFLEWVCGRLAQDDKKVFVLVWDNASWHSSQKVRDWIRAHNARVKREGGVRILKCFLPIKSPWLNRIEPHWVHGKRAIVEPARTLDAAELIHRVCTYFACDHVEHLKQKVS